MQHALSLQVVMTLAANEMAFGGHDRIEPEHLLMGLCRFAEFDEAMLTKMLGEAPGAHDLERDARALRSVLQGRDLEAVPLRRRVRSKLGPGKASRPPSSVSRSPESRTVFAEAEAFAAEDDTRLRPRHLLRVLLDSPPTPVLRAALGGVDSGASSGSQSPPVERPPPPEGLWGLNEQLQTIRAELLTQVFGQDHAVHTFIEGLYGAEVVATADEGRKRPKGLFVFAGPPGVGKTWLAECGAGLLARPFRRFDMSSYGGEMGSILLAGAQRSYKDAQAGQLTSFVEANPDGVLLFDEVEKAHISVVHLFLQILDAGVCEDRFTEKNVAFRDTVIIMTTNAGRSLYDDPDAGALKGASFHRNTVLNALATEKDPRTGRTFFPEAICSRMATGHPVMFNHLGIAELERIAAGELARTGELFDKQYGKRLEFDSAVPLLLVMREGGRTDARTVRSRAESFVKTEMFRVTSLYERDRLQKVLNEVDRIRFELDDTEAPPEALAELLSPSTRPRVLLAARPLAAMTLPALLPDWTWSVAMSLADALAQLAAGDFDLVLLDLWFDPPGRGSGADMFGTALALDHVPLSARSLRNGQALLSAIHKGGSELPCFLLSFDEPGTDALSVDDELMLACARAGGARGRVHLSNDALQDGLPGAGDAAEQLEAAATLVRRERVADSFGRRHQAVGFDVTPAHRAAERTLLLRIRNLRTTQAVAAEDHGGVMSEAERPTTLFSDVFGAAHAKAELQYIVTWLKEPGRLAGLGLRPPRGVLLTGPPGTGKTMLARALAGESEAQFIVESATNFVTKWVGSGPENVRNLFARGRRYAPAIIFIDEIDAVGTKRGGGGHNRSHEETLNALLTEMDGFSSTASRPVIVIAATNLSDRLDDALKRRFDREVEVDKPDRDARKAYLQARLQGPFEASVRGETVDRIARQSANMTIAELERVLQFALRKAAMAGQGIDDASLDEAFETMRMGEAKGRSDPASLLRVARHEAGHCLIGWLRGDRPMQVTIVARGNAGGYVEREADESRSVYTKPELEGLIRQAMGGRAAELVFYGLQEGLSSGVSGDLKAATHWARLMVEQFGMSKSVGLVSIDSARLGDGPVSIAVHEAIAAIVSRQLDEAVDRLQEYKAPLEAVVAALMDRNRLTREDLTALLADLPVEEQDSEADPHPPQLDEET